MTFRQTSKPYQADRLQWAQSKRRTVCSSIHRVNADGLIKRMSWATQQHLIIPAAQANVWGGNVAKQEWDTSQKRWKCFEKQRFTDKWSIQNIHCKYVSTQLYEQTKTPLHNTVDCWQQIMTWINEVNKWFYIPYLSQSELYFSPNHLAIRKTIRAD